MSNESDDIGLLLLRILELRDRIVRTTESLQIALLAHVSAVQLNDSVEEQATRNAVHELSDHIMDLHIEMISVGKTRPGSGIH